MSAARAQLERCFSPEVVAAIAELVEERLGEHEPEPAHDRDWLTAEEAAERWGCSADAARRRAARGRARTRYVGRRLYLLAADVG